MDITQKSLNKVFAYGVLGLYTFGFGATLGIRSAEYTRTIGNYRKEVSALRSPVVSDNHVTYHFNTLNADYDSVEIAGGHYAVPYVTLNLYFDAKNRTFYGDAFYCAATEDDVGNDFDSIYLDYTGSLAYYRKSLTATSFQYQSATYDPIRFLTDMDANGIYSYSTLYEYQFYASMSYSYADSELLCDIYFKFKTPSSSVWKTCEMTSLTYYNVNDFEDDFSVESSWPVYNNADLVSNLNYSNGSMSSFQSGVDSVLADPSSYDLYTYTQYLAYGQERYNQGRDDYSHVLSMSGVMNTIFTAPISMFMQVFTSRAFTWTLPTGEVLDLGGLMTFFLTIGIALAIVRLIMKVGGK